MQPHRRVPCADFGARARGVWVGGRDASHGCRRPRLHAQQREPCVQDSGAALTRASPTSSSSDASISSVSNLISVCPSQSQHSGSDTHTATNWALVGRRWRLHCTLRMRSHASFRRTRLIHASIFRYGESPPRASDRKARARAGRILSLLTPAPDHFPGGLRANCKSLHAL